MTGVPEDQEPARYGITPENKHRELIIPAEMVYRGLRLAAKIEEQLATRKCQEPIVKLPGLLNRSCVAFSKNGKLAAITSHGKQRDNPGLVIWNLSNRDLSILPEAGFQVAAPPEFLIERIVEEFSDVGNVNISVSNRKYKPMGDPASKPWDINCVALSGSGSLALIGYVDGSIGYCDIDDGVISSEMRIVGRDPDGHKVGAIAISPDNCVFAEASGSVVRLWEIKSGREIWCLEGYNRFYNQLSFSDDGSKLLIANCRRLNDMPACMALMDVHAKTPHLSFVNDQSGDISAVAISSDNHRLVSYNRGTIAVWAVANGRTISQWRHTDEDVNDIIDSYSAGDQAEIPYSDEYDIEMRSHLTPPLVLRNPYLWGLSSVAISPDGNRILSGGGDRYMRLWTLDGRELWEYPHESRVVRVAFHPDGHRALAGCWNGSVYAWELPQKQRPTPAPPDAPPAASRR
jgi:WD40 repeat protein